MAGPVACFGLSLFSFCVNSWENPNPPVTFDVRSNATNPVKVGDLVEFSCTAHNLSRPESTIIWKQIRGSVEHRMLAGHNRLVWKKTILSSDHDTAVFCAASFFTKRPGKPDSIETYYAMSTKIPIQVKGGTTRAIVSNKKNQGITLSVAPVSRSYKVGDYVQYTCTAKNMKYPVVDVRQRKGQIERQIYVGYQAGGYRWKGHKLTESDDGSVIYCQAWLLDERMNSYAVNSELYPLNVH